MDTQELVVLMSAEIALMSNGRMFFDNSMCLALQQQVGTLMAGELHS